MAPIPPCGPQCVRNSPKRRLPAARQPTADRATEPGAHRHSPFRGPAPGSGAGRLGNWRAKGRQNALGHRVAGETDLLPKEGRLAMGDVAVGQSDSDQTGPLELAGGGILDVLEHSRAEATRQDVVLHRDEKLVLR